MSSSYLTKGAVAASVGLFLYVGKHIFQSTFS